MVLWVVGLLIAIPFFVIVASLVLELVVPLPEEHGPRTMIATVIALMLLALGGVMAWLGLRRGLSLHDRFFAPVFVVGSADGDRLVARSETFARAVRELGAGADYRRGAGQVFVPPALPSYVPAVVALAVALGLFGAGFARYHEAQSQPTVLLRSVEIVAHGIAGAPGLLALYVAIAVLIGVAGVLGLVGTQRARRDILAEQASKP